MQAIKISVKRTGNFKICYTLMFVDGRYIITARNVETREAMSAVLPQHFFMDDASHLFEYVCASRTTPCALSDIIDDALTEYRPKK